MKSKDINLVVLRVLHKANNQPLESLTCIIKSQKGSGSATKKDIQKALVSLKRKNLVECVNGKWGYLLCKN